MSRRLMRHNMTIARLKLTVIILAITAGYAFLSSSRVSEASAQQPALFPHGKDKHKTLECSKCHVITAEQIDVKAFPPHAACAACHNLATESLAKPVRFCGICHNGQPISKQQPALFAFPKQRSTVSDFGDNFSHPSHLKPQTSPSAETKTPRCDDCHKKVEPVRAASPELTRATGHRTCFECHGEKPVKPPNMLQCAECHKLNGAHSPDLFGIVKEFRHSDHDYDIRPKKKAELRTPKARDYLCIECHASAATAASLREIKLPKESYCGECHNGKIGLPDKLSDSVLNSIRASAKR
ncbi:MAG: hypothetical protein DMF61_25770 [Blastocatellia bacterium AA13]|nr:MAG: hypothetical protein DMF61_25770 [Blastocatellia bacterium AA13]